MDTCVVITPLTVLWLVSKAHDKTGGGRKSMWLLPIFERAEQPASTKFRMLGCTKNVASWPETSERSVYNVVQLTMHHWYPQDCDDKPLQKLVPRLPKLEASILSIFWPISIGVTRSYSSPVLSCTLGCIYTRWSAGYVCTGYSTLWGVITNTNQVYIQWQCTILA